MLRIAGESSGRREGESEWQESGGLPHRNWRFFSQARHCTLYLDTVYSRPPLSLLLEHLRKFPVSATGGLMLTKYVLPLFASVQPDLTLSVGTSKCTKIR